MTPDAVRLALGGYFGEVSFVRGPVYKTDHSEIFLGECHQFEYPLAIKHDKLPSSTLEIEAKALRELAESWRGPPGLRVPRFAATITNHRLLISEWIVGTSLKKLVTARFTQPPTVLFGCQRAGAWLAYLHSIHPAGLRRIEVDALLSFARERVSTQLSRSSSARLALAAMETSAGVVERTRIAASRLHGDFKPENVIVSDSAVTAVDISFSGTNVVAFDLVQFLNHLEAYAGRKGRLFSLAFLSGYGRAPTALPLLWMRLFGVLKLWSTTLSGGRAAGHPIQYLRFRWLAESLSYELMQELAGHKNRTRLVGNA